MVMWFLPTSLLESITSLSPRTRVEIPKMRRPNLRRHTWIIPMRAVAIKPWWHSNETWHMKYETPMQLGYISIIYSPIYRKTTQSLAHVILTYPTGEQYHVATITTTKLTKTKTKTSKPRSRPPGNSRKNLAKMAPQIEKTISDHLV